MQSVSQDIHCPNTLPFPICQSMMSLLLLFYKWGTSAVPTDIIEEFANASHGFQELGEVQSISLSGGLNVCIAPEGSDDCRW
jgi:hypothetical protein